MSRGPSSDLDFIPASANFTGGPFTAHQRGSIRPLALSFHFHLISKLQDAHVHREWPSLTDVDTGEKGHEKTATTDSPQRRFRMLGIIERSWLGSRRGRGSTDGSVLTG
jgi:hypothetical protein